MKITFKFCIVVICCVFIQTFMTAQDKNTIDEHWHHLDIESDSVPGISLDKAYNELLKNKKSKQDIIVAVLDTKLDYTHQDLKDNIWINTKEIPGNNIDDDNNGYIDDINGWNFLGNDKNEDLLYQHTAELRYVKRVEAKFENKSETDFQGEELKEFKIFQKASLKYQKDRKSILLRKKRADSLNAIYFKGRDTLRFYFKNRIYTETDLDSLLLENPSFEKYTRLVKLVLQAKVTEKDIAEQASYFNSQLDFILNKNYDDRSLIGDNPLDINDRYYGNNIIDGDVPFQHATYVAGALAAIRKNNIGIKGISDNIKIMPVVMVASGEEYDKDISIAVRYAVENGANVINMSWVNPFSPHSHWVKDALIYAQSKDVLVVNSAGNENDNLDIIKSYPLDYGDTNEEYINNFIVVGASTKHINKPKASFSSYGKNNVDVFAPGEDVYTTYINNSYKYNSGTSFSSPIVAGIAALIRSHYPSLTAPEVKQILMDSSVRYDVLVDLPTKENPDQKVPFSELSKSGGIVNAYNALLLAEKVVKEKQ